PLRGHAREGRSHGAPPRRRRRTPARHERRRNMSAWDRIPGMEDFWPVYVAHHADARNRAMHDAGSVLCLVGVALAIATGRWWIVPLASVVAYGLAFTGHFVFEKNVPLTLRHPVLAALADMRMFVTVRRTALRARDERA